MPATPRVCSVTVAFDPDPARLAQQLAALRGHVDFIVIVDNGSDEAGAAAIRRLASEGSIQVVSLPSNEGVAGGLNRGIAAAQVRGCDYVLLLDHDSVPAPGMVAALLSAHQDAATVADPVAAVGPRIRDSRDGHEFPFVRLGWLHNPRVRCASGAGVVACDFLISSGSLVSMEAFRRVGAFDAALFVDYVDLDWCCRARAMGYSLYGACGALLDHELGEEPRNVIGGVRILVHSPERLYYMTRNRMLLYRRSHVPLKWKLKDLPRALLKLATSCIFLQPRGDYARMAALAARDALANRGGRRSSGKAGG